MTCIVSSNIKTKKQLKEVLASAPALVGIEDPSIFKPRDFTADEMKVGQRETLTNHPKRSWFASIVRTSDGFRVE